MTGNCVSISGQKLYAGLPPGKTFDNGVVVDIPKFSDNYCPKYRKWIDGKTLWGTGKSDNFEICQTRCDDKPKCDAFIYNDHWCWLWEFENIKNIWPSDGKMIGFKRGGNPKCPAGKF